MDVEHVLNILLPSLVYRDIPITVMVKLNVESVKKYFHLNLIWNVILKHVSVFWYVTSAAWGVKQLNCCEDMLQLSIRIKWSILVRHVGMSFIPNNPSLHMLLQIIKQCFSHHNNQIIFPKRKLINSLYTSKYDVLPTIALKWHFKLYLANYFLNNVTFWIYMINLSL